ncbi:hypothetical protein ABZ924_10650 [Streptomyces sp. NPDC046876]|uniref:hypothetical protein n=1 Tax=Streptomyces sp. NPDC046876 TaxID=3155616 RepID=UPI0033E09FF0
MRARRATAAAVLLGAVVLAGCGAGGADGAAPNPSHSSTTAGPGTPTTPTPTPTTPRPPSAAERLVTVTRSGGFAGRTTSLLVKGDGSWIRLDGKARQVGAGKLSPDGLARLRSALAAADFPHLPRVPRGGPTVYDGFTYAFVHGGFEVMAADGSIPAALSEVLSALPPFEGS